MIGGLAILVGCAGRQAMVSREQSVKKEPDQRAINHFVDGILFDLEQNFGAALLSYQEALLYDSSASAIYLAMAKDYVRLNKAESAIISLKRCLEFDRQELEAWELLSQIYLAQGKWKFAEDALLNIVSQDSLRLDAYFNLAHIYKQNKDREKALNMYHRMLSVQPMAQPETLIQLGELYFEMDRFDEAADTFRRFIEIDSIDAAGWYGLGMTYEAMEDTIGAIKAYSTALKRNPGHLPSRDRLSRIHILKDRWDEAVGLYSEAVRSDSMDLASWLAIAEIYRQKGDTVSAIQTLREIQDHIPQDWRASLELGRIFLDQQRFVDAYHEFINVTKLSPQTFWGWLFSGVSLVHLDSLKASESYLRKALQQVPEDPLGNYYLGSALAQLNRPREAIPFLEQAIRSRPDGVPYISALAGVYESLNDYQKSDDLYNKALQLEPENALILNNYGYSLSERGVRLDEAIKMAQKALEIDPTNGAYLDTMGWIYYKLGQYEEALRFIEEAYAVRKSAEVTKHLGDVYDKLGMKDRARETWEKALELDSDNPEIIRRLQRALEE